MGDTTPIPAPRRGLSGSSNLTVLMKQLTTSRMRRHAPFEPIDPNFCMWGGVADVINCAKFFENPSKGFGAVRHRKIAFPIEIVHRPYNSVDTTVPHCDKKRA